jgi:hypothetical protein
MKIHEYNEMMAYLMRPRQNFKKGSTPIGKKSGPPPKSGPMPQGLNINYNTVKTVKLEKINGRNRQVFTKRKANNKRS